VSLADCTIGMRRHVAVSGSAASFALDVSCPQAIALSMRISRGRLKSSSTTVQACSNRIFCVFDPLTQYTSELSCINTQTNTHAHATPSGLPNSGVFLCQEQRDRSVSVRRPCEVLREIFEGPVLYFLGRFWSFDFPFCRLRSSVPLICPSNVRAVAMSPRW